MEKFLFPQATVKKTEIQKEDILNSINQTKGLGLSPQQIDALVKAPFIGVPISQLAQQAQMPTAQMNSQTLPGIPAQDTSNNQMIDWMRAVNDAYQGRKKQIFF